jgi:hypothetical protein
MFYPKEDLAKICLHGAQIGKQKFKVKNTKQEDTQSESTKLMVPLSIFGLMKKQRFH